MLYTPISKGSNEYKINVTNLSWVGDGGVYTSLNDFIKWDQNFYENKLGNGNESLIQTMEMTFEETKASKEAKRWIKKRKMRILMPLLKILPYNGFKRWSHSGSWVGWLAHYARFQILVSQQLFSVIPMKSMQL